MKKWFNVARQIATETGLPNAQRWIQRNVPPELAPVIDKNIRVRLVERR